MCLSTVSERIEKPSRKVVRAWKVFFRLEDGTLEFAIQCGEAKRGCWLKAWRRKIGFYDDRYTSGFHAYASRAHARTHEGTVLPVKLRYVRTIGEQDGAKVLVADEMLIPRKGKHSRLTKTLPR